MILLVDDKPENLFSLKSLLQLHSYAVDTASSGEEALKKVLKNEYALIILDVQMPGMDGYEVAETITGYSRTKHIPIIFLSAVNIDKRFITRGYSSGGVDYITKPFDPDLMLLKVNTFCRLYEQNRELNAIQGALKDEIESRKHAQQELEAMNNRLENIVQERTGELIQINKELEESNAELQQYAFLASHDLQEPLRKIIAYCSLLSDRYLVNVPESEYFTSKIISSTERMRNLINDLLNYSKLSSEPSYAMQDLGELARDTISDLEYSIEEKKARILVSPLPKAEVIGGQVRQLFQNLLSNALKFSKKDEVPSIRIEGEIVGEKSFDSKPNANGSYVRISISDNGIGFNEIYLGKIFTIFQRLHGRKEYEGTGIGLAIVKKIVDKHHGLITAVSREGIGTSFIILLPIHQTPEPALSAAREK